MTAVKLAQPDRQANADLQPELIDYAGRVDELRSTDEVLDGLHAVTTKHLRCASWAQRDFR